MIVKERKKVEMKNLMQSNLLNQVKAKKEEISASQSEEKKIEETTDNSI